MKISNFIWGRIDRSLDFAIASFVWRLLLFLQKRSVHVHTMMLSQEDVHAQKYALIIFSIDLTGDFGFLNHKRLCRQWWGSCGRANEEEAPARHYGACRKELFLGAIYGSLPQTLSFAMALRGEEGYQVLQALVGQPLSVVKTDDWKKLYCIFEATCCAKSAKWT